MKKVLVVLMLLPLFFCCNDDDNNTKKNDDKMIEDTAWREKTYKVKIEIDKPAGCYYYYDSSEERQGYLYKKITLSEYKITPKEEKVSFVVFEGGKDNAPKFTAKLYIDDKFIAEGKGVFDGDITDVIRFEYNFKTKKVQIKHNQEI